MRFANNWCVRAWVAAAMLAIPAAINAADITARFNSGEERPFPNQGRIQLTGTIEQGDYQKLADALGDREGGKGFPIVLSLDSKGGSFEEALRIANLLLARYVTTTIQDNHECLSACAIIFMAGTYLTTIGPQIGRTMAANATLGSPNGAEKVDPPALAGLLALARTRDYQWDHTLMKLSLVHEMIAASARGFYFIDTVRQAAEFEIGIDQVAGPPSMSMAQAKNGCANAIAYLTDSALADSFASDDNDGEFVPSKDDSESMSYSFRWRRGHCRAANAGGYWSADATDHVEGEEIPFAGSAETQWVFWPGDTPLKNLPLLVEETDAPENRP